MAFGTIEGLYLLGFLIPLIILYLIKAKPKKMVFPSLLFLVGEKRIKKFNALFQKLLVRTLFFIQAFFIILLALSSSNLTVTIPLDAFSLQTIAVVDVSASMATLDGAVSRMDAHKEDILSKIKGRTTIVLAEDPPIVIARNVSASHARSLITSLKPKDTPGRVDSALLLANDLLGEEKGTVLVYSDFLLGDQDDILAAKKLVETQNKRVVLIPTGSRQDNLGFVSFSILQGRGEAFIKNFGERGLAVDVALYNDNERQSTQRIDIRAGDTERVAFDIKEGKGQLDIVQQDRLRSDDSLYFVNPFQDKTRILFITNQPSRNPLLNALRANTLFDVRVTEPPVVPDLTFDVVVINNINSGQLLPNAFRDFKQYKDNGGIVILTAQNDFSGLNFYELFSFSIGGLSSGQTDVCLDTAHEYTSSLKDCFTTASSYHSLSDISNSSVVLASTASSIPLFIAEQNFFYYGIIDSNSAFKDQISYPLFWDKLIHSMLGKTSLQSLHYQTGDVYVSGNQSSKTILDTAGIREINGNQIAVNVLNPSESNTNRDSLTVSNSELTQVLESIPVEINLGELLLILAIILFFYELFYVKKRGDL